MTRKFVVEVQLSWMIPIEANSEAEAEKIADRIWEHDLDMCDERPSLHAVEVRRKEDIPREVEGGMAYGRGDTEAGAAKGGWVDRWFDDADLAEPVPLPGQLPLLEK